MFTDKRRADSHRVELFATLEVVVVQVTAERDVARSIRVAERGGARDHDISADISKKVDRLARGKAALCRGTAELRAENRIERLLIVRWMG